jgi:hypothetical protein
MPLFNGVNIFGRSVTIVTAGNPRDSQRTSAAGINGVATMDLGDRGRITTARGVLTGSTPTALFNAEQLFDSYRDGRLYTLVDNFNATWIYVRLDRFVPQGRVLRDPFNYGFLRAYEAEFSHMI